MPRLQTIDIDPANVSLTGLLSNATGATWTLTATSAGDSLAHQISIRNDAAVDHSAKDAVLTGTDADGRAQTETVSLPGTSATVESTKYFLTLTTIVPSVTIGSDTMDIGWVDEVASKTYPLNRHSDTGALCQVDFIGTIDITVQTTAGNVQVVSSDQESIPWVSTQDAGLVAITANDLGSLDTGASAMRILINSYTDTAEIQAYVSQASD